jgi:hypothetical protein
MAWDALQLGGSLLVAGCYERFLFGMDTGAYDAPALKKARAAAAALARLRTRRTSAVR